MKKYTPSMCAMLLALMLGPPGKLSANTVSMTLTSVSQSLGNYYVAPYQFSVGGQTAGLICDDASDDVYVGESWTATTETFSNLSGVLFTQEYLNEYDGGISQTQAYDEAGWLVQQIYANISNTSVAGEYQYALWDLFVPNFSASAGLTTDQQSAVLADLSAAGTSYCSGQGCYSNLVIYTPTQVTGSGRPQEYFGVMPEPMTLWSLLLTLVAVAIACMWVDKIAVKASVSASM